MSLKDIKDYSDMVNYNAKNRLATKISNLPDLYNFLNERSSENLPRIVDPFHSGSLLANDHVTYDIDAINKAVDVAYHSIRMMNQNEYILSNQQEGMTR